MNQPWGQVKAKTSAMHIGFTKTKLKRGLQRGFPSGRGLGVSHRNTFQGGWVEKGENFLDKYKASTPMVKSLYVPR
jgi:hypothetical protein